MMAVLTTDDNQCEPKRQSNESLNEVVKAWILHPGV